jgi:hypothetical protein
MSSDLIVLPVAAVRTASDTAQAKAAVVQPPPPPPAAEQATNHPSIPNPKLRLDPELGLVVIEFRNDNGTVTTSIPSQRQLEAYQRSGMTHHSLLPAAHGSSAQTPTAGAPTAHEPGASGKGSSGSR